MRVEAGEVNYNANEIVTSSIVQIRTQNSHISKFLSECMKIRKHNDNNIHCTCKKMNEMNEMK